MKDLNSAEYVLSLIKQTFPNHKFHKHWITPAKDCETCWIMFTFRYAENGMHDRWTGFKVDTSNNNIERIGTPRELMEEYSTTDLRVFYNKRLYNNPQRAEDYNIFKYVAGF